MTDTDYRRSTVIIKRLDWIQSRHLLSTLKGELRSLFGDLTIELNKLRRK